MDYSNVTVLLPILGLCVGGLIGLAFGVIQREAKRRNEKRQEYGKFSSAWRIVPGSMTRVALFMAVLVLIQIGLPVIFDGNIQWIVSAGVVLGYGWMLFREYRHQATTS